MRKQAPKRVRKITTTRRLFSPEWCDPIVKNLRITAIRTNGNVSIPQEICILLAGKKGWESRSRVRGNIILQMCAVQYSSCACKHAVTQLCPTLCNRTDCSPPGSSVHGILQARILEWAAVPSSKGSSQPRDQIQRLKSPASFLSLVPPGKPNTVATSYYYMRLFQFS